MEHITATALIAAVNAGGTGETMDLVKKPFYTIDVLIILLRSARAARGDRADEAKSETPM